MLFVDGKLAFCLLHKNKMRNQKPCWKKFCYKLKHYHESFVIENNQLLGNSCYTNLTKNPRWNIASNSSAGCALLVYTNLCLTGWSVVSMPCCKPSSHYLSMFLCMQCTCFFSWLYTIDCCSATVATMLLCHCTRHCCHWSTLHSWDLQKNQVRPIYGMSHSESIREHISWQLTRKNGRLFKNFLKNYYWHYIVIMNESCSKSYLVISNLPHAHVIKVKSCNIF